MMLEGKIFQLVILLGFSLFITYGILSSGRGKVRKFGMPPAILAIEEAMGRCIEMGRPFLFQTGIGDISGDGGAIHMAMLGVLTYTARMAAQKEVNFIVTTPSPTLYPLAEDIVKDAYTLEGKPNLYSSDRVRFLSNDQMAYCSAVMQLMQDEHIGANIQIGFFQAECLITLEAAKNVEAINIGGAVRALRIPDMAVGCDYFLMGEEVFAAGAFCRKDPVHIGALFGQDLSKLTTILILVVGSLFVALGSNIIVQLMGM
jgi:hypothetical protein